MYRGFPGGAILRNPPANAGDTRDLSLISVSWRSPGVGNHTPIAYSCFGNPMNRVA